ncbi:MAG: glycosyltransferase family 2 protein [Pyrinomonadaceae bacterium]
MPENPLTKKFFSTRVGRNVLNTVPKVSVVMPAYNCADHIVEAIDSVLAQKFREYEIIVINDGSPDTPSLERAIRTRLDEIVYIRQRNEGAAVARNMGIDHARGELIAFLDSDDVWEEDFLTSQYIFLERNNYDMVYCDALLYGMRSAYRTTFMETAPSEGEANFESILGLRCNVITSGTLARRSSLLRAGMFEKERVQAEDFHLWLRMAKTGAKIGYQRKVLLKYRVHEDGLSGDAVNRVERSINAFERVRDTIDLMPEQGASVERTIAGLKADLAVQQGKSLLVEGDYQAAARAFRTANRHRWSPKLAAVSILTRLVPGLVLKAYQNQRPSGV